MLRTTLIVMVVACGDDSQPTPDATIHVMPDDARPDADCAIAGQNRCCYESDARSCFAAEMPEGVCGELVCACEVVAACHPKLADAGAD